MSRKKTRNQRSAETTQRSPVGFLLSDDWSSILCNGYTSLDRCPEIMTGCHTIAELIGSMTIHLISRTQAGDIRIENELSRILDITPEIGLTRQKWMEAIVMNLLLYGRGNSVVVPHTHDGYLESLEPITASRVQFMPDGNSYRRYRILIDGVPKNPDKLLHFTHNTDPTYLWKGRGLEVTLRDVANNLKQAAATERGFMESKWKPSVIVKVDALTDEFSSPEGRSRLLESYVKSSNVGEPWLIPADQFAVEQIRPLSLADLAIKDTVELDKRTVASVLGVPAFLLGVGEYNQAEWNKFVRTKLRAIVLGIQQEMTRKLITSPKWYVRFNIWSLLDYDLKSISDVLLAGSDRGFVNGDEWRDRVNMSPAGLTEYRILENYIPADMSGDQKKLVQDE